MEIEYIIKRDYSTKAFHLEKISGAIHKAMNAVGHGDEQNAQDVALSVYQTLVGRKENDVEYVPTIEEVQDIVETKLMESKFTEAAKAYILYRNKRTQQRESDLFEKRVNLKPYEYPHLYEYVPAIRHSYWIHSEFNFTSDIQDFKSRLSDVERSAIKNTMLAISQIEVAVKSFWGDLYHRIPKPEVGSVGSTFAESEVRHADAYSHLLEILGLNVEFKELKKKPAIMKRVHYLEKALKNSRSDDNREYAGVTSNFFTNTYVDVSPLTRTQNFYLAQDGLPFNDYDIGIARDLLRQEKFDDYMVVNMIGGKSWKIDDYFVGFFASINNILDQKYRTGGFEQGRNANYQQLLQDTNKPKRVFGPKYWYGRGTNYFLNLYFRF